MIRLTGDSSSDPLIAWSTWQAVSLHFNPERNYDAFKMNFKGPRCKRETFQANPSRLKFERLARRYSDRNDIILYSVSNVIEGNAWIGNCSEDVYESWKGKIQGLEYRFKTELGIIADECGSDVSSFNRAIFPEDPSESPTIYRLFGERKISLETLAALESLVKYTSDLDRKLVDPLEVSKTLSHRVKKYAPFLSPAIDKKKYSAAIIKMFT
jgi:hypothetical protein